MDKKCMEYKFIVQTVHDPQNSAVNKTRKYSKTLHFCYMICTKMFIF